MYFLTVAWILSWMPVIVGLPFTRNGAQSISHCSGRRSSLAVWYGHTSPDETPRRVPRRPADRDHHLRGMSAARPQSGCDQPIQCNVGSTSCAPLGAHRRQGPRRTFRAPQWHIQTFSTRRETRERLTFRARLGASTSFLASRDAGTSGGRVVAADAYTAEELVQLSRSIEVPGRTAVRPSRKFDSAPQR